MAETQLRSTRAHLNFITERESPSTIQSVFAKEDRMIARSWHGYTKPEHAHAYESMLKPELLPGVSQVKGYRGSYLLRREAGGEIEFVTIMLCCAMRRRIGVQRDLGGCAPIIHRIAEKGLGSVHIAASAQEEIHCLSGLVHGPIQVHPPAPNFYICRLMHGI